MKLSLVGMLAVLLGGCATSLGESDAAPTQTFPQSEVLVGAVDRSDIEAALPEWVGSTVEAEPDMDVALQLADLQTSARLTVFFGSWCTDSRRELSRLWAALDLAGGEVGFPIDYIAVDRSKQEPAELVAGREILYVPTLIVEEGKREVGRIIEQPAETLEADLLALLAGTARGWISARTDLPTPGVESDS